MVFVTGEQINQSIIRDHESKIQRPPTVTYSKQHKEFVTSNFVDVPEVSSPTYFLCSLDQSTIFVASSLIFVG